MFQSPGRATVSALHSRAEHLANGKVISGKRVANNTYRANIEGGGYIVVLHETPIIAVGADGAIEIDTGGYNTHTTRDRLNSFLPEGWRVHTEAGVIYLHRYLGNGEHTPAIPFGKRCSISASGEVTPDLTPADLMSDTKLLNRFMGHVRKVGLPTAEESKGDPWVFTPEGVTEEVARDWLESLYWTRRLFILALQATGMPERGVALSLAMADRSNGRLDRLEMGRVRRLLRRAIGRG